MPKNKHPLRKWGKREKLLFVIAGSILSIVVSSQFLGFGTPQQIVFSITITTLLLWLSEIVPLHVTALGIPFMLVIFGGFKPSEALAPFFDSVVILVLGGFVIALTMNKHGLDKHLGQKLFHNASNPRYALLGIMFATALISMWMANSATAALMMPIGIIILKENKLLSLKSSFAKSMVLGIGFAATIGGLGTLVGSTPNVLVSKFLTQSNYQFGFMEWSYYGIPMMIVLVFCSFLILTFLFKPEINKLSIKKSDSKMTKNQKKVLLIFALTIILWLTSGIHKINIGIISLVPIFLIYGFGLLNRDDFKKVDWPSLILIGGGISLGFAMHASTLDVTMANALGSGITGQSALVIALIIISFGVALTAFASNTAAASVLIPLMIPLGLATGIDPKTLALLAGIGVSLDFVMPSGTPPTTIAYASGYVRLKDLLKAGILVSIVAIIVCTLIAISLPPIM